MTMFVGNDVPIQVEDGYDRFTGSRKAMTSDHSYIHDGLLFETFYKASVNAAANMDISILTPAATAGYVHLRPSAVSGSGDKITITLHEAVTMTGGTGLTSYNHNRNSTKTAGVVAKHTPTVTNTGTAIGQGFIGGGTGVGGSVSGGERGEQNEWVLKPTTQYLLRINNASSAANIINANVLWYEEPRG